MKNKIKNKLVDISKNNHVIMVIIRMIRFILTRIKYLYFYVTNKVDSKMVIFESYMGRQYSCSPKAIYLELLNNSNYKDYKFVWAFKDPSEYSDLKDNHNTIIVEKNSSMYFKYFAKAKYFVVNSRIEECIIKKKKQIYVQCWHGTPLKKLGYDITVKGGNAMNTVADIKHKYRSDSKKYNYMISPSKFCTEKFISAFKLKNPNIILETGYPRNDYLYSYTKTDVENIKKKLKIPSNKKVILYAPTWRDNEHVTGLGYVYNVNLDFGKLKEKIGKDYVVLFRAHYFIANKIDLSKYSNFVYNVSSYTDINDLYIISDLLITDYSSVFFDYANLKRPIIYYMYDFEKYKNELRDFYIDLEELPGPIIKDEKELIDSIVNIKEINDTYKDKYQKFNMKYNYLDDKESSKRVVERIFEIPKVVPLIFNITKKIKYKDNSIYVSGTCLTKVLRVKKYDINDFKISINDKKYNIYFALKKGIPFIKKYYFNKYMFSIPIDDLLTSDIQNKILIDYKENLGRIIYNIFDFKKGKNRNSKIIFINDKSIYLRQTIKNTMYLTVRDSNYFDTIKGKFKIILGYLLSKFYIKNNIILLFEKNAERYEESASVLYERLIDEGYKNVYYIINKDNVRIPSINNKYKENFLYKNSLKHIIYFFKCKKFIGTESIGHSIQLRIANRLVINKENKKNLRYVFLQHGVMYMISLSSDLRTGFKKQNYKLHKIVVSSKMEAMHFVEQANYKLKDLYISGLPKFDKAYKNKNADKIVIMPTWRRWEVNESTTNFENTRYFKMIKRIVSAIPKKYQSKIIILPHPLMLETIRNNDNYKKYLPEGEILYDDILRDTKLLITDYSSISYDAFYRGCNVIFYWEEKDYCLEKYGANATLMLKKELAFGDVCYNKKDLQKVIEDNYIGEREEKYIENFRKIVTFHDNKNTERLIDMLKKDNMI